MFNQYRYGKSEAAKNIKRDQILSGAPQIPLGSFASFDLFPPFSTILESILIMSDTFRKAISARLPRISPARAPWADGPGPNEVNDKEGMEELEGMDDMSPLGGA